MTQSLRLLGLAFMALLAVSALWASAAHAAFSFTSPEGAIDITGHQVTQNILTTGSGEVKCGVVELTGTTTSAEVSELKIEPHFSGCTAFGFTTHVNATSCVYLFATPSVALGGGQYTGDVPSLKCPNGGSVTLTPTLFGFSLCTMTIGEQKPTGGHITFWPQDSGTTRHLLLTFAMTGIHYASTGGVCGLSGATNTDGTYTGSIRLKGFKHGESHIEANHRAITLP